MSYKCDTCKTTFKNKTNLNAHIKTAKYCIKLRENILSEEASLICNVCNSLFSTKFNLQKHFGTCSSHVGYMKFKDLYIQSSAKNDLYEKQLEMLQKQLDDKEKQLTDKDDLIQGIRQDLQELSMEAVKRPSTINNTNNNTNNILIASLAEWNPDEIIKNVEASPMSEATFDEGLPAIGTHYAKQQTIFQDSIPLRTCDRSRKLFQRKLADGVIVKEKNAITFIKTVQPTILNHSIPLHERRQSDYDIVTKYNKLSNISIPNQRKFITEAQQRLQDIKFRSDDHPDKIRINNQIEQLDDTLKLLIEESCRLKMEANSRNLCLSDPDFHLDKMQKSAATLNKVKHLTDSKNASAFASGLVDVFP
jgi:hypothetical protein